MQTKVKTAQELDAMRKSGHILAQVLALLKKELQPGMTTKDLSTIAKQELKKLGGKPAFLGYYGFPDVLCVSVNDEVVHGIPSAQKGIEDGDIVSMDFGVIVDGMITDAAISVIAGTSKDARVQRLLKQTERALQEGIAAVKNGCKVGDIGAAVERVLDKEHYGIVRDLVGHGVGHELHEEPNIPNYGHVGTGQLLKSGMTIAIEPMATLGTHKVYADSDGWTIKTKDESWSAHFEHTILVTQDGAEILTSL